MTRRKDERSKQYLAVPTDEPAIARLKVLRQYIMKWCAAMQARRFRLEDRFVLHGNKAGVEVYVVTEKLKYPTFCIDGTDDCMYETVVMLTPVTGIIEHPSVEFEIPWKTAEEAIDGHKKIVALLERANPEELIEWVPRINEEKVDELLDQV